MKKPLAVWLMFAVILLTGAWFRLHELGMAAFRADTILLYGLAQRPIPVFDVLTRWFDVSGAAGQMPMPAFAMKAFLSMFSLDPTPFNVRLPFALFGILTIPAAYWVGCQLIDRKTGLLFAAFIAWHPFMVHFSREAYFYASGLLGYVLYFGAVLKLIRVQHLDKKVFSARDLTIFSLGLFFSAYSQITAIVVYTPGFLILAGLLIRQRKQEQTRMNAIRLVAVHAVILAPVLFASWGFLPILSQIGANKEYGDSLVALSGQTPISEMAKAVTHFSWGWTTPAIVLLILSLLLALWGTRQKELRVVVGFASGFLLLQLLVFYFARAAAGAFYEPRYMAGIFPCVAALLVIGLGVVPGQLLSKKFPRWAWIGCIPAVIGIGWLMYPANLAARVIGKPTPYFELVGWADAHLPPGTSVLVDRWFEPWNEMRAHPGTNVVFTFTVPNEPLEQYLQVNWRKTAQDFFIRFPDAAYCEIAKSYQEFSVPGPWSWPRSYFRQHHVITNEPGLQLRNLGLAARSDFYAANTNRLVVEFFYNTREDILDQARSEGRSVQVFYGAGLPYEKSGPMGIFRFQTQQFYDWRVLEQRGELEVVNIGEEAATVSLRIFALSPRGPKLVSVGGNMKNQFSGPQMQRWDIGPITLAPGTNTVVLDDPIWDRTMNPLLIASVEVVPSPVLQPIQVSPNENLP